MSDIIETNFRRVVENIFNNWTALQLAVENKAGGPTSHQTAVEIMNWICNFCLSQKEIDVNDIQETLEDILDEEFSTICEDDSPKEIAYLLVKFLTYLRENKFEQFELEFKSLPARENWLSKPAEVHLQVPNVESSSEEDEMKVESEWICVTRKRR